MTLEEVVGSSTTDKKMETVSSALESLLVAAQRRDCLTVGVYESAKLMNVDPDSVVLCVLATDEEDLDDIALQIHFTLLQAFCCDNDINILRVSGLRRLGQLLDEETQDQNGNEPRDLHCILSRRASAVPGLVRHQQLLRGEPLQEPVGARSGAPSPLKNSSKTVLKTRPKTNVTRNQTSTNHNAFLRSLRREEAGLAGFGGQM
ncbi:hypothetical protein WMY93_024720 [Mugilogobius chulae]|uniref:Ribosomal protein eL8/eL30/eS12/Gadd45 domain-containing protein n=1 Tax=Mugilogobius chulae TaxID=88201 RepID=A0AAW0NAU2_9GOBI